MNIYSGLSLNAVVVFQRVCVIDTIRYNGETVNVKLNSIEDVTRLSAERIREAAGELIRKGWCEYGGARRDCLRLTRKGWKHPFRRQTYKAYKKLTECGRGRK